MLLFASAMATSVLGLHALIGGFILGVALHQHLPMVAEWKNRLSPLVNTLLLPIFFTHTGLRTDVGTIGGGAEVIQCALICGIAFLGKYGGAYLSAPAGAASPREVGELTARQRAAASADSRLPAAWLLGSDQVGETAMEQVRLLALGVRLDADDDRRMARLYFADPDIVIVLVLDKVLDLAVLHQLDAT